MRVPLLGLLLLLVLAPTSVEAQRDARLEIILPAPSVRATEPPFIRSVGVLAESRVRDLLQSGFPARLHYRVELWSTGRWFDDMRSRVEWDVIVRYTPLDQRYTAARVEGDRVLPLGSFDDLRMLEEVIGRPFQPPIRPTRRGERVYYNAVLDVQMISVSDLDEVERWLRGELRPAVRGERSPGTALTRGMRTLAVKLLGGESRQYVARSPRFRTD